MKWSPDTCGCQFEQTTDDQGIHFSEAIYICSAHSKIKEGKECFDAVLAENQRKNFLFGEIEKSMPEAFREVTQQDGSRGKALKEGLEYKWSFDENRVLDVELVGFTAAQKNQVQGLANSKFGQNKVRIK